MFLVPSLLSLTSSASLGPVQRDPPVIVSPVELCGTPPRLLVRSLLDDERGVAADGMKAVVRYAGRGARCSKASLSITLGELVIASIDAVVRRLHRTVIKRPTVPLQEDANVIGPLPPGLYKVAAEAQEAGCSIVTEPIPLVGATQRRRTAGLPILVVAAQGTAVADGPAAATSERAKWTVLPRGGFQRTVAASRFSSDSKTA